jgi:ribosomal protein S18 acetylase RimI-like enzyme
VVVNTLPPERAQDVVTVLCDAFHDYPVMRYVLGPSNPVYDERLRTLIGFFVSARVLRNEPMLGVDDGTGNLAAAAILTLPRSGEPPAELIARREAVWLELGAAERQRYDAFGEAGEQFTVDAPHCHLNMIGVRRTHAGRGLGRRLMDAVHQLSGADPASCGVTLSTEDPLDVPLYERFGYRVLGHARVSEGLETWGFFRPNDA